MMKEEQQYFDVSGESIYQHAVGDVACAESYCGGNYPKPCECGGLIHADFGDENWDGDYWLYTKCDRCGESE
jgi:hypothetical protein